MKKMFIFFYLIVFTQQQASTVISFDQLSTAFPQDVTFNDNTTVFKFQIKGINNVAAKYKNIFVYIPIATVEVIFSMINASTLTQIAANDKFYQLANTSNGNLIKFHIDDSFEDIGNDISAYIYIRKTSQSIINTSIDIQISDNNYIHSLKGESNIALNLVQNKQTSTFIYFESDSANNVKFVSKLLENASISTKSSNINTLQDFKYYYMETPILMTNKQSISNLFMSGESKYIEIDQLTDGNLFNSKALYILKITNISSKKAICDFYFNQLTSLSSTTLNIGEYYLFTSTESSYQLTLTVTNKSNDFYIYIANFSNSNNIAFKEITSTSNASISNIPPKSSYIEGFPNTTNQLSLTLSSSLPNNTFIVRVIGKYNIESKSITRFTKHNNYFISNNNSNGTTSLAFRLRDYGDSFLGIYKNLSILNNSEWKPSNFGFKVFYSRGLDFIDIPFNNKSNNQLFSSSNEYIRYFNYEFDSHFTDTNYYSYVTVTFTHTVSPASELEIDLEDIVCNELAAVNNIYKSGYNQKQCLLIPNQPSSFKSQANVYSLNLYTNNTSNNGFVISSYNLNIPSQNVIKNLNIEITSASTLSSTALIDKRIKIISLQNDNFFANGVYYKKASNDLYTIDKDSNLSFTVSKLDAGVLLGWKGLIPNVSFYYRVYSIPDPARDYSFYELLAKTEQKEDNDFYSFIYNINELRERQYRFYLLAEDNRSGVITSYNPINYMSCFGGLDLNTIKALSFKPNDRKVFCLSYSTKTIFVVFISYSAYTNSSNSIVNWNAHLESNYYKKEYNQTYGNVIIFKLQTDINDVFDISAGLAITSASLLNFDMNVTVSSYIMNEEIVLSVSEVQPVVIPLNSNTLISKIKVFIKTNTPKMSITFYSQTDAIKNIIVTAGSNNSNLSISSGDNLVFYNNLPFDTTDISAKYISIEIDTTKLTAITRRLYIALGEKSTSDIIIRDDIAPDDLILKNADSSSNNNNQLTRYKKLSFTKDLNSENSQLNSYLSLSIYKNNIKNPCVVSLPNKKYNFLPYKNEYYLVLGFDVIQSSQFDIEITCNKADMISIIAKEVTSAYKNQSEQTISSTKSFKTLYVSDTSFRIYSIDQFMPEVSISKVKYGAVVKLSSKDPVLDYNYFFGSESTIIYSQLDSKNKPFIDINIIKDDYYEIFLFATDEVSGFTQLYNTKEYPHRVSDGMIIIAIISAVIALISFIGLGLIIFRKIRDDIEMKKQLEPLEETEEEVLKENKIKEE